MERTTRLTEERIAASAAGAPAVRRDRVVELSPKRLQAPKHVGSTPTAHGPGLVCGSSTVTFHTNDHVEMGRTAWDGTPLGSSGAGYG